MNIIIKLKASDFYFYNQIVSPNNLIKKQQQYNHKRNLTGSPFRKHSIREVYFPNSFYQ